MSHHIKNLIIPLADMLPIPSLNYLQTFNVANTEAMGKCDIPIANRDEGVRRLFTINHLNSNCGYEAVVGVVTNNY